MPPPPASNEPLKIAVDLDGDGAADAQGWDAGRDGDVRYIAIHDPLPPPEPIKLTIPNLLARNQRRKPPAFGWVVIACMCSFAGGVFSGKISAVAITPPHSASAELLREWCDKSRSDVYFSLTPAERKAAREAIRADEGVTE